MGVEDIAGNRHDITEVDWSDEIDVVHCGCDYLTVREAPRRNRPTDIHPVENGASKSPSEVVRVVRHQYLTHLRV